MSQRRKRLEKLAAHRERELDQRLSVLADSRAMEQRAAVRVQEESKQVERARDERSRALSGDLAVKNLALTNDFLVSCTRRKELADLELVRARRAVSKAQSEVIVAKNELKKIELLGERLGAEERKQAERVEQRMTDEVSARRSAAQQKRRSES